MKALKSNLAKQILATTRIPLKEGAIIMFNGKEYTVKYVPAAK